MVAAAIANKGVVMTPHLVDRIVAPGGKVIRRTKPEALRRAVKTQVAREIRDMMVAAVTGGTGGEAQVPGITVAGKTGTAETGVNGVNTTWFVCFAPAENPKVAVAVVLENQHGFAGQTAAPIARTMMQAILQPGSK
jgi:peptidoglycan glycosyltransferase